MNRVIFYGKKVQESWVFKEYYGGEGYVSANFTEEDVVIHEDLKPQIRVAIDEEVKIGDYIGKIRRIVNDTQGNMHVYTNIIIERIVNNNLREMCNKMRKLHRENYYLKRELASYKRKRWYHFWRKQ